MNQRIDIGPRVVGTGQPSFVMAEVAMNHDGSLGAAHAFIDAIADAGADCVKFQTRIAAAESTLDEPFRVRMSGQDETRYAYWRRMEFTEPQWRELVTHAQARKLIFISSAFSVDAVHLLRRIGVPAWKLGSGEFRFFELLAAMAEDKKPILASTGMSTLDEIDRMVEFIRARGAPFGLFQCISRYPARQEDVGLNVIDDLAARHGCPVGLSDHSGTLYPALAAMARGAAMIEVHVTFDKRAFGPDVSSSITLDQLAELCRARDAFAAMLAHPVDKNKIAGELQQMRDLFLRSAAPARALGKGAVLQQGDLIAKRPGTGIPAADIERLIGRRLARDVSPERLLQNEDLE